LPEPSFTVSREDTLLDSGFESRLDPVEPWLSFPDPQVKILDFGLAKEVHGENCLTRSGVILGSVDFLSPEQASGAALDARSDLYSVGIILYQLLTGNLPLWDEDILRTLRNHMEGEVPPVRVVNHGVDARLEEFTMRLLKRNPGERFQNAEDASRGFGNAVRSPRPPREASKVLYEVLRSASRAEPCENGRENSEDKMQCDWSLLDGLSETEREVVVQAALIGDEFPLGLVSAPEFPSGSSLRDMLNAPGCGKIVQEVSGDPDLYRFRHPSAREALLSSLTAKTRKKMFLRIAKRIELHRTACDALASAPVLCGRSENESFWERILRYIPRVAEQLAEARDFRSAAGLYATFLELWSKLPEPVRASLQEKAANALLEIGRLSDRMARVSRGESSRPC
jgi:hypothetical protein